MTNNYNYKNIVLSSLISDINSSVASKFSNITQGIGTNVTDLTTMENSATLNYRENNVDISSKTRAKNEVYNTAQTNTTVTLSIPGTTLQYTHFTLYAAGGNGGGGGAGGDAETNGGSNVDADTSIGGVGGVGGYVALTSNIALNGKTLQVTVGSAGNGGTKGADDNDPGQNGSPGNSGNSGGTSYVYLGGLEICRANGGGGGGGGGGANSGGGNGNTGATGNAGSGSITSGYTGNTTYTPSINPPITLTGGVGGDNNGKNNVGNNVNIPQGVGLSGNAGYVRIYLKYNP